jgi:hypothetical protein
MPGFLPIRVVLGRTVTQRLTVFRERRFSVKKLRWLFHAVVSPDQIRHHICLYIGNNNGTDNRKTKKSTLVVWPPIQILVCNLIIVGMFIMEILDITKPSSIIDKQSKTQIDNIFYRDVFAISCYLHLDGHTVVAIKLCNTLFDHLGTSQRKEYLSDIVSSLPGNELDFASRIAPHGEIENLLKQHQNS